MYKEACEKIYKYHERTIYYVARNDIHDLTWVLFKIYIYIYIYVCVYNVNIESLLEKTEFFQQWQKNKNKKIEREREREEVERAMREWMKWIATIFTLIHLYVNIYIHNLKDRLL